MAIDVSGPLGFAEVRFKVTGACVDASFNRLTWDRVTSFDGINKTRAAAELVISHGSTARFEYMLGANPTILRLPERDAIKDAVRLDAAAFAGLATVGNRVYLPPMSRTPDGRILPAVDLRESAFLEVSPTTAVAIGQSTLDNLKVSYPNLNHSVVDPELFDQLPLPAAQPEHVPAEVKISPILLSSLAPATP